MLILLFFASKAIFTSKLIIFFPSSACQLAYPFTSTKIPLRRWRKFSLLFLISWSNYYFNMYYVSCYYVCILCILFLSHVAFFFHFFFLWFVRIFHFSCCLFNFYWTQFHLVLILPNSFEDYHHIRSMFSWSSWIVLEDSGWKSEHLRECSVVYFQPFGKLRREGKVDIDTSPNKCLDSHPSQSH